MDDLIVKYGESISITRYNPGTRGSGRYQPGASQLVSLTAVVQPMNAEAIALLPEGRDIKGAIKVFSQDPLQIENQHTGTMADRIAYGGEVYEVMTIAQRNQIISHYEATAKLMQDTRLGG